MFIIAAPARELEAKSDRIPGRPPAREMAETSFRAFSPLPLSETRRRLIKKKNWAILVR